MKRFLILLFILCACFASALAIRDFLNSVDYNGLNLISLGIASFNIQYTVNTGINFGIAGDASFSRQLLLSVIAIVVCLSIIIWGLRTKQKWSVATAGLFAGGGLANAYERISFGGVFDYINFSNVVFDNPFSFNLADIYIFFGLLTFLFAPKETHDPADGPLPENVIKSLAKLTGNFAVAICLLVSCIYTSWQILSQSDFFYEYIYDLNNLEGHISEFAPQNVNKSGFEMTTKDERLRIFSEISKSVNSDGDGLKDITYEYPGSTDVNNFLISSEINHLQDVADLISKLKPIGAITASFLFAFYAFCWIYKVSRYQYFWRPPGVLSSLFQVMLLAVICIAATFIIGPQKAFYLLHELAFSGKSQWFFYYQESLMVMLLPEVVFANIAIMIGLITVITWVILNFIIRRMLI